MRDASQLKTVLSHYNTLVGNVIVSNLDHLLSVVRVKEMLCPKIWGKPLPRNYIDALFSENCWNLLLNVFGRAFMSYQIVAR